MVKLVPLRCRLLLHATTADGHIARVVARLSGDTPLHAASSMDGGAEAIAYLLQHGATVDSANAVGQTPLHVAVLGACMENTIELLRAHGELSGRRALCRQCAVRSTYSRIRVTASIYRRWRDRSRDKTPVDIAAEKGRVDIVPALLGRLPNCPRATPVDVTALCSQTMSPLHIAAKGGHLGIVKELIECGFDVNTQTDSGTALHEAVMGDKKHVMRFLISAGVRKDLTDRNGRTAMALAREYFPLAKQVEFARIIDGEVASAEPVQTPIAGAAGVAPEDVQPSPASELPGAEPREDPVMPVNGSASMASSDADARSELTSTEAASATIDVPVPADAEMTPTAPRPPMTPVRAQVVESYEPNSYDDSSVALYVGDEVTVFDKLPSGLWRGESRGKIGQFPSGYVIELSSAEPPPLPPRTTSNPVPDEIPPAESGPLLSAEQELLFWLTAHDLISLVEKLNAHGWNNLAFLPLLSESSLDVMGVHGLSRAKLQTELRSLPSPPDLSMVCGDEELSSVLRRLGLEGLYERKFADSQYMTAHAIRGITEQTLRHIGITMDGHIQRILHASRQVSAPMARAGPIESAPVGEATAPGSSTANGNGRRDRAGRASVRSSLRPRSYVSTAPAPVATFASIKLVASVDIEARWDVEYARAAMDSVNMEEDVRIGTLSVWGDKLEFRDNDQSDICRVLFSDLQYCAPDSRRPTIMAIVCLEPDQSLFRCHIFELPDRGRALHSIARQWDRYLRNVPDQQRDQSYNERMRMLDSLLTVSNQHGTIGNASLPASLAGTE